MNHLPSWTRKQGCNRSPVSPPPAHGIGQGETQVSAVVVADPESTIAIEEQDISSLLTAAPALENGYGTEQMKDPDLKELIGTTTS